MLVYFLILYTLLFTIIYHSSNIHYVIFRVILMHIFPVYAGLLFPSYVFVSFPLPSPNAGTTKLFWIEKYCN